MDISREKQQRIKEYYLQDAIVEEMVRVAKQREFAATYDWGYGSRPDAVNMPGDFRSFVEDGAIAFHGSVELWQNPHLIGSVDDHDTIRTGWDLVIDIDCDESMEFAKVTAQALVEELQSFGVDHVSVKFSGNRGFHLGVRREAFPDKMQGKDMGQWYPILPQAIVDFLRHRLYEGLAEQFLNIDPSTEQVMREAQADENCLIDEDELNPYAVCDIENDWGDRHLFRLPYSLNEKSWLVALPIEPEHIMDFEKPEANMDQVDTVDVRFLDNYEENEAVKLSIEAWEWAAEHQKNESSGRTFDGEFEAPDEAIPEEYFPPTIKNILSGLKDGRKRALFILLGFLPHCGYDWESVERMVWEWNERNEESLDETYVEAQIRWMQNQSEPLMPPNFDAKGYYKDLNVYEEDPLTQNVNNPVSYAFAKAKDDDEIEDKSGDGKESGNTNEKETVECPYCGKEYKGETKWYRDHVMECDE